VSDWMRDFESIFCRHFDTPDEFIIGIGYMVAGSSLANRVFMRSPDELTTNLYLLLCSPPGWYHKSSPLRAATRILRRILSPEEFIPSYASSEALGKIISDSVDGNGRGHGIIIYDEFRSFLAHIRKEYAANVGSLVVERFERGPDLQFVRKSRAKDDEPDGVIRDVIPGGYVLSFVASTTTPWLLESMKGSDITGGMLSRFLLIEAHEKTRSRALPIPVEEKFLGHLAERLQEVRKSYEGTEFQFSPTAASAFEMLYHDIEKTAMRHEYPEYPSLISRAPTYVKKMALINAALRGGRSEILEEDLEEPAGIVVESIRSCERVVDEFVSWEGTYSKSLFKAKRILASRRRIAKRDLLRMMHMRVRDLDEILESLSQQGLVLYEKEGRQEFILWRGV